MGINYTSDTGYANLTIAISVSLVLLPEGTKITVDMPVPIQEVLQQYLTPVVCCTLATATRARLLRCYETESRYYEFVMPIIPGAAYKEAIDSLLIHYSRIDSVGEFTNNAILSLLLKL